MAITKTAICYSITSPRAVRGRAAAAPPSSVRNSRRFDRAAGRGQGRQDRAILKVAGRSAIMLTMGAFNLAMWMFWALLTLLAQAHDRADHRVLSQPQAAPCARARAMRAGRSTAASGRGAARGDDDHLFFAVAGAARRAGRGAAVPASAQGARRRPLVALCLAFSSHRHECQPTFPARWDRDRVSR
jgi:hypothetical protein